MGSNRKQPFGYRIEGGRLVTHPEEQSWVVHIFCQYNSGASFQEIADALSERLVCGECGTLYRRCVWSRNGKKKVVWRCVSRLDYGTKFCHASPTMEEGSLQQAILNAINSRMSGKEKLAEQIANTMHLEMEVLPDGGMTLGEIKRRIQEMDDELGELMMTVTGDPTDEEKQRLLQIMDEMNRLKCQQEEIASQLRTNSKAADHIRQITTALDQATHHLTEWDETAIRQLVHTVKVISADRIIVYLNDGTEVEQEVLKQSGTT